MMHIPDQPHAAAISMNFTLSGKFASASAFAPLGRSSTGRIAVCTAGTPMVFAISAAVMLLLAPILEKKIGNAMRSPDFFAISALAATICAVPALIGIGNTLFLNKQKSAK